ncbi:MAG: PqqD family protein [Acidobacteria bacterium]|nr:PqqD family protein [Acidobacteriota bacterium]
MKNPQNPVARKSGLVIQEVPEEVLVYDMNTNKAHCLNKTAALVWRSCDGNRSVSEIANHVGSLSGERVTDDFVWLAIDQLNENDLLEKQIEADFRGLSRRDVIKRIGLTSMVALPVIASLIAPPTAMAAASCNCNQNFDCTVAPNLGCPANTCNGNGLCRP